MAVARCGTVQGRAVLRPSALPRGSMPASSRFRMRGSCRCGRGRTARRASPRYRCRGRVAPHGAADLRRKDYVVTAALECPTDYFLRVFIAVSGVDEVDPRVERLVDDPDRVLRVGVADPGGEHERAERVGADLDACSAEVSVLHEGSPDVSMTWVGASVDVRCIKRKLFPKLYGNSFRLSNTGGPWHPSRPGRRLRRRRAVSTRLGVSALTRSGMSSRWWRPQRPCSRAAGWTRLRRRLRILREWAWERSTGISLADPTSSSPCCNTRSTSASKLRKCSGPRAVRGKRSWVGSSASRTLSAPNVGSPRRYIPVTRPTVTCRSISWTGSSRRSKRSSPER